MKNRFFNTTLAPFTYLVPSLNTITISIIAILSPQILMLFMTKSFESLILIFISILASTVAELLHNSFRKKTLWQNPVFIVQGLIIGMFIPKNYPVFIAFFTIFLTLIFVKYIFGGAFYSWINPVVFTIIMLYFLNSSSFPTYLISLTDIESGNPALGLFQNDNFSILPVDLKITNWLNNRIFSFMGIEIPEGYITLFWDTNSIIPAFRFNCLTLLSSIFLISFNMINALIPCIFLFVYGLLVRLFGINFFGGNFASGDILLALMTSGTLFSAFFLID